MSESQPSPGPSLSPIEQAAVRKLMDSLDPEEFGEDETMVDRAIRVGEEFQRMQEQMNTLSNQLVDVTQQVEELNAALENDAYEQLTHEQKRLRVKRLVQNEAKENGGRGAVDYNEVRSAFNKRIPAGSTYNLMEEIGQEAGYEYQQRSGANNRLAVDISETDEQVFTTE